MERKAYLALCERYAAFRDVRGVVQNPDTEKSMLMTWKGVTAYPLGYRLEYTTRPDNRQVVGGKPVVVHYAVLRVKDVLTELTAPLSQVEPFNQRKEG